MKDLVSLGLKVTAGKLTILDQTKLPHEELWHSAETIDEMIAHIRTLRVRGAPLIGVAAGLALARLAEQGADSKTLRQEAQRLRAARPTAVNLMMAVDRLVTEKSDADLSREKVVSAAVALFEEDVELCERIAKNGEQYIQDGDSVLTHCNTGGLATVGAGTALAIIRKAHESGKKIHVYVDETRPLLQGARLTTWELSRLGIPYTLICDNMAASLMRAGKIKGIFVGADRIAKNGDAANKIGTYSLAVLAKHHGVPFYIAAPYTTVDLNCPTGAQIPVEEREADEVRAGKAPTHCAVYNPAFDVTPRELITKIILDRNSLF